MSAVISAPPPLDSFEMPPYPVRRWTVAEYRHLAETGVLTADDRVELLEGWIVPKVTHNPPHDATIQKLLRQIMKVVSGSWGVRVQSAIDTSDSEPEPDLAVVQGPDDRFAEHHPTTGEIELVVEVANTSLSQDRRKQCVYAGGGIPVYWIVNLVERRIEVYSSPDVVNGQYCDSLILQPGDSAPLILDGIPIGNIPVDDILPPSGETPHSKRR